MRFLNFFRQKTKRVYFDYGSATPLNDEVKAEMVKYFDVFHNPSGLYEESFKAKEILKELRSNVALYLNVLKNEIIFTSGGTEGNNLSILGVYEKSKSEDFTPHIITCATEHPSILDTCKEAKRRGAELTILPVSSDGRVSQDDLKNALRKNTVLVSISLANSEIGTIQPIREYANVIKEWRGDNTYPYFHTDASGASIYLTLDPNRLGVDLLTLDGGKIYGPKGIGVLFVKSNTKISPIVFGGGQEDGLRSGTENIPSIAGFAKALFLSNEIREKESIRLASIRDYGIEKILKTFPDSSLNGPKKHRLPNNISICFPKIDSEFATISLDIFGVSVSYSSSCITLKEDSSSYVIRAIKGSDCDKSSLRFTLGVHTKKEDIDYLIEQLKKVVNKS